MSYASVPYLWGETKWAARTSLRWVRLLIQSPRLALQVLKPIFTNPDIQQRMRSWRKVAVVQWGHLRVDVPTITFLVVALYSALHYETLAAAFGYGALSYLCASVAMCVLPFVLLASPVIVAVIVFHSVLPVHIPDVPAEHMTSPAPTALVATPPAVSEKPSSPVAPGLKPSAPDTREPSMSDTPVGEAAVPNPIPTLQPNGTLARELDGKPRTFSGWVDWLLNTDGSVELTEPKDLARVQQLVDALRAKQARVENLRKSVAALHKVEGLFSKGDLFVLGFFHEKRLDTESMLWTGVAGKHVTFKPNGLDHTHHESDKDGEPLPRKDEVVLVHPDGGYLITREASLAALQAPKLLKSRIARDVMVALAKSGEPLPMKSWRLIKHIGYPALQRYDSKREVKTAVLEDYVEGTSKRQADRVEERVLAGSVRNTQAIQVRKLHDRAVKEILALEDFLAHQQRVVAALKKVLGKRLARLLTQDKERKNKRIALRKKRPSSPYDYLQNGGR